MKNKIMKVLGLVALAAMLTPYNALAVNKDDATIAAMDETAMGGNVLGGANVGNAVNLFFTDPNAFFLKTDADGGLQHFKRKGLSRGIEGDFESGNMRYKSRERYVFGWHEPRGAFGSSGSS